MYIYRPHRSTLEESMDHAAIYEDYDLMVQAVVKDSAYLTGKPLFSAEDVSLGPVIGPDDRIGWQDCRRLLVSRFAEAAYDTPQCIGFCATLFPKEVYIRK